MTVEENQVTGNQFTGIGLASTLVLGQLAGLPPEAFGDIEPDPDGDRIVHNRVVDNGTVASPIPIPGADLLFVPAGSGNCWSHNRFGTSVPDPLPACPRRPEHP